MTVYFVQHGSAVTKDVDPDRPLSEKGREEVERISVHLEKIGVCLKKVCHSGKTRARETAQIISRRVGDGTVSERSGMNPNDSVVEFARTIDEDDTMYVGHLPHMEKLVSYLITGNEDAGVLKFSNGGVVCLQKDGNGFHIDWYLKPSTC